MPQVSAFLSRLPVWQRPPPGILKTPPRFFSLPRRHSAKTLRFQVDERAGKPASDVRQHSYEMAQDLALAGSSVILSPRGTPKSEKSESSSTTSTESSSDDKPHPRGLKRRHSPSPSGGRRNSSACEVSSVAPYWMPDEIRHYFLNYNNDEEESGDGRAKHLKKGATASASALQRIGLERPPQDEGVNAEGWKRFTRQPHSVLATLCFAAAFALILAAMSSDAYSGLVHGAKGDERTPAVAGASAAYSRAAQQESASGRVASWSKEELPGERKATKASRVATRPSTRWHEGVALDEKKDEDEEQGGDLVLEGGLGPDQTETGVDDASRGEPARPQVTVGPGGTRTNAAEGVRGFGDGEAMTLQSQVPAKSACGMPLFVYCQSRRLEFYYKGSINACVSTSSDKIVVCNRSPNRFSSKESCLQHCIEKQQPAKQCRKSAVFSECTRQDVLETWWFYGDKQCQRWSFPSGRCPVNGSDIFTSFSECSRRCNRDGVNVRHLQQSIETDPQHKPCRRPRTDVCGAEQLRFAYFADTSAASTADGRSWARCHSMPVANQLGHRCLAGTNRFHSARACRKTCVVGG
ncbi:uncharacterized protein [Dermacentor andersoni]|uniref:uncharacterized protein n=1 Tax=Dermacentor andersoni TaxID=34620 RepID=UPI002417A5BA|nr:uncharacterized protein LOC126548577 [Dermacentor andersoni]